MNNNTQSQSHIFHRLPGSVHMIIMAVLVLVLGILFTVLNPTTSNASPTDNVTGYAWSGVAGAGWISLNNCSDATTCSGPNYGVSIDATSGSWSGSGWSSNVGWVDFGSNPCGSVSTNLTTGVTSGMAHVRSQTGSTQVGGFSGCIKMSGTAQNGSSYGVLLNMATGNFSGYAWSGDDVTADTNGDGTNEWILDGRPDVGLGWIDFSYAQVTPELLEEIIEEDTVYVDLTIDGQCNSDVTFNWDTNNVDVATCDLFYTTSSDPNQIQQPVSGFNVANVPMSQFISGPSGSNLSFLMTCESALDGAIVSSSVSSLTCLAEPIFACNDGDDNDDDGLSDENDPQCHTDCNASNPDSYNPNDNNEGGSCLDPENNPGSPLNQTGGSAPIYIES